MLFNPFTYGVIACRESLFIGVWAAILTLHPHASLDKGDAVGHVSGPHGNESVEVTRRFVVVRSTLLVTVAD